MSTRLIAMVAVFGLVLAACGSGSADVATLGGADGSQEEEAAEEAADGVADDEAAVLAFTRCMRDQGIEFEDPVVDSDGNVQKPQLAEGADLGKETKGALKTTWDACEEYLAGVTFGTERGKEANVDQYVELAACLRDEGFDLDDPTAETLEQWQADFKAVFDFEDPDAQAAFEACGGAGSGDKDKGKDAGTDKE